MSLIVPFPQHRIHSLSRTLPEPRFAIQLYLDKEGFQQQTPNINVIAVRWIEDCSHVCIATVCAHCLANRPEYRKKIRMFLRLSLSDQCIESPSLRALLHSEIFGNG